MNTVLLKTALWSNLLVALLILSAFFALLIMGYPFEGPIPMEMHAQWFFSVVLIIASVRPGEWSKTKRYSRIVSILVISSMAAFDSLITIVYSVYSGWFEWSMLIFFVGWALLNALAEKKEMISLDRTEI